MTWLARRITTPALLGVAMLLGFAVVLGCAIASGELLRLAERPSGATAIDSSVTSWAVAHRTPALTTAARLLSTLGSQAVLIPLTAISTVALLGRRRFARSVLLLAAWGGAIGLYSLTKDVVGRMRPPPAIWLTDVGRTTSFPSGHATQSSATFVAIVVVGAFWLPNARWPGRVIAVILAIGVGWSRVYLGVHWATDVGAGWLIAAAWLTVVLSLARPARSIQRRRHGEPVA
ncbi:MAG: phosphatase PAP2 family protein [Solirubrobacteraceae bacterium]